MNAPGTLPALLDAAVARAPDAPAVRCDGQVRTYGQLQRDAERFAWALIGAGVQPGDRVGIHRRKHVDVLAAVYGTMMAGAAYVPLDPAAPIARVARIASDCAVAALLTDGVLADALEHRPGLVVVPDEASPTAGAVSWSSALAAAPAALPTVTDDDLAYLLYTSGSTGTPKGVALTHANARSFVDWACERMGVVPQDRLANHAPLHFDLSVFDLYVAAAAGAEVVLVPERRAGMGAELVSFVREEQITVWYSVPSALTLMVRAGATAEDLGTLRCVVFAGEVFPVPHLQAFRALVPHAGLWNLYGPTETNVCTYHEVTEVAGDARPLPIGVACENGTEVFPVGDDGSVVAVGVDGELYVTGPTVMRGYWGDPERSAEALVADPRGGSDVCYRTGDIVRLRPDGALDLIGRRDHQVKSRGYRIELGEVEAALHRHPDVADAVVVAVPHEDWGTALVGQVVARQGAGLSENALRRHVASLLPRSMVPVRIDLVAGLPLTANGKIDRRLVEEHAARTPLPGAG